MVKITIQYDGQDDVVVEGEGLVYAMASGDKIKGGVVGEFSIEDLLNIRTRLDSNLIKCLGKFGKETN